MAFNSAKKNFAPLAKSRVNGQGGNQFEAAFCKCSAVGAITQHRVHFLKLIFIYILSFLLHLRKGSNDVDSMIFS